MNRIIHKDQCTGCSACYNICLQNCICMAEDDEGFLYPEIDMERCIQCGKCERVCPVNKNQLSSEASQLGEVYAAYSLDDQVRKQSSSGGIFFELAKQIISSGGTVVGAALQTDMCVRHQSAETTQELEPLLGSKYVQSDIADTYRQAETLLKQNRLVLFTGTPCQIAGLYGYLGKNYDNLITQDIICHGVPSPRAWKSYLDQKCREFSSHITGVSFREKSPGWKFHSLRMEFENQKVYCQKAGNDMYMRAFATNFSLRPSCYHCAFKGNKSGSDITLADFWGIEHCLPEMADDKGISLVLLHSSNGVQLFESIRKNLECRKADLNHAVQWNPLLYKSVTCPDHRKDFMEIMRNSTFDHAARKYCKRPSIFVRFLRKMKKWMAVFIKESD